MTDPVPFFLDDRKTEARSGESILQAATRAGIAIPHLCASGSLRPDGNCRTCMVEIEGERLLQPSCTRVPTPGMRVHVQDGRARRAQKTNLELLCSEAGPERTEDCELHSWARRLQADDSRFTSRDAVARDESHPAILVDLDSCIQCTRCLRACRESQGNDVIGYANRGAHARIVFDFDAALEESSCVGCGECVQACPTGALRPVSRAGVEASEVDSVCPYCGVGCLLRWKTREGRIAEVQGIDGPSNHGRLCVKGRYGYDYLYHPDRLTEPLIRRPDAPKEAALEAPDVKTVREWFRPASWEEALDAAASGFRRLRETHGPRSLAGFGSAKGSNEEAYLFQKLVRTGFGSNQVDHCTRLCHASSVAALLEGIGSAAVSNPVRDAADAEVILVIGANPTVNHPVAATFLKNAAARGASLIVLDPRRTDLARHATLSVQFRPDTDVALLNSLLHTVIEQGWTDPEFLEKRTRGFDELRKHVRDYSPERIGPICGVEPSLLREVARLYATARASMIFWGMGISQHVHGTDNARCLIALALVCGQIGRRGTGLHPLRGQNNVQGASDAGLIPMVYPDYQRVDDETSRKRFEEYWGCALDPEPGRTVVELINAAHAGDIRGMYVMGENPAMSDPHLHHTREALARLEHLVVQDLFLTETAAFADVVLPAAAAPEKTGTYTNTDRRVQLGRPAHPPPGQAREDLWIVQQMARRMGLDWPEAEAREVFQEMRGCMDSIHGIAWGRLEREGSVTYPCENEGDPGQEVLFAERFPTADGRASLVPASFSRADELPDDEYPEVLITGRLLEHWHTGAMTRRASVLNALEPDPVAFFHPADLERHGLSPGAEVRLRSRRGGIECLARIDEGLGTGQVFLPFCYREAAANLLTNPSLDPYGKIPGFKFCALRVERP